MLIHTASSSGAFVAGDRKVCILSIESFIALQQSFRNTNNGGKKYSIRILNSKNKKRNKKVKNQKKYQGKDSVKLNS